MITSRSVYFVVVVVVINAFGTAGARAAVDRNAAIRTVALSDEAFPGVPAAVNVESFAFPRVDAIGRVAFKADLLHGVGGTTFGNDTAIWSESAPGDLQYEARAGNQDLNLGYTFDEVEPGENLRMSAAGVTYFLAGIFDTNNPVNRTSGLFSYSATTGLRLLVADNPIPGQSFPTTNDSLDDFYGFNSNGTVSLMTGSSTATKIWTLEPVAGLQLLTSGGSPKINELGTIAFGSAFPNNGLYAIDSGGARRLIAAQGAAAAGIPGATFRTVALEDQLFTNTKDGVLFVGRVQGTGIDLTNDEALWGETRPGGDVHLLLREGSAAPGLGSGVIIQDENFTISHDLFTFGRSGGISCEFGLAGPGVNSCTG